MKKTFFTRYWFEISLIGLSLLAHLYIVLRPADVLLNWYSSDDGFYYFKVAANIASGLGATFDGISRTNGFHPLWMLVCIPIFSLTRYDPILPLRLLVLVSALFNTGTALLIFYLLRRVLSTATSAAMAVVWMFLPSIHMVVVENGMESAISAFFLALLIFLVTGWRKEPLQVRRLTLLGVVAGLTLLARLDNIFVVMLLGIWFVLGQTSAYLQTLVVGDLGLIFIVGLLGYYLRLPPGLNYFNTTQALPWHIGLSFLLIPLALLLSGLYSLNPPRLTWNYLLRCVIAVTAPSMSIGAFLLVSQRIGIFSALPRSVILINFAGTLLSLTGLRLLAGFIFRRQTVPEAMPIRSWQFLKSLLPRGLGYFLPVGLLLGAYMLWSYSYVGLAMPISGTIKHWWGSLPNTVYGSVRHTWLEVFGLSGGWNAWGFYQASQFLFTNLSRLVTSASAASMIAIVLAVILAGLALAAAFVQRKWVLPLVQQMGLFVLFISFYAQIFNYSTTGYLHPRDWYWAGELLFSVLCTGVLLECVFLTLKRIKLKPFIWPAAMGALSLAVLVSFAGMTAKYFPPASLPGHENDYISGIWTLEKLTEPGSLIGSTGGGQTAYFIRDRTVVNLDGLINGPEYFQLLQVGKANLYLDKIGLDYVFGGDEMLNHSDPYSELFKHRLMEVPGSAAEFVDGPRLYRYNPNVDSSLGLEPAQ